MDYRYTGGTSGSSISFLNSTANEDVYISTANTYTLIFGSYATSTNKFTLASNKRIKIGPSGWSGSGSIQLYNVEINGSSPFTLSINSSSSVNIGNPNFAIAYSNPFDITSGYFNLSKGTFNDKFTVTKTGTGVNNIYGGNTFNDTLDIRLGAGNITMHLNANDAYNEDIYVSNTGTGVLYFGNGGNGCTLASGKRILIGSSGFNSGTLSLQKFTQTSTTAQSITLGGTTTSFFIGNSSTFNGTLTIQAPNIDIGNSTFNKKVTLTKTGSVTNYSYGGNTYNDTLDIRLQAGSLFINYYGNDVANGDLYVSNTGSGSITLGSSPTFTLATGKKIYIGSAGFASGTLAFGRFIQSGTTDQSITLTSSAAISFGACTFNGRVTATTPSVFISGATFNKKFTLIKNGATNLELTGGNTFNDTVDYQLQNGNILFATSYNDTYNGDLIVSNTGSGTMTFGFHGSSTLASGKKIEIGSAGFANGGLTLNRFVQNGTADQIITLTGTAGLVIGGHQHLMDVHF
ncbi:MAG: hypothetical protein M0D57_08515 [Sphingobacteriales bacterium JAD_PAG50586_3]|nr:MAG: hypothetical protein M0D57_08515 [Sphingobacteriales bacterium JAD_PAG50586_3]